MQKYLKDYKSFQGCFAILPQLPNVSNLEEVSLFVVMLTNVICFFVQLLLYPENASRRTTSPSTTTTQCPTESTEVTTSSRLCLLALSRTSSPSPTCWCWYGHFAPPLLVRCLSFRSSPTSVLPGRCSDDGESIPVDPESGQFHHRCFRRRRLYHQAGGGADVGLRQQTG